jgi:hypothetical protein
MWWSITHPHFVFLQDAENDPQRRSQSPVSLQRNPPVIELSWQLGVGGWKRSTLQSPSSLRPSWDAILSILREA